MEGKFIQYMTNFDFVDLMGFAKLLKVDEKIISNAAILLSTKVPKEDAIEELVVETVTKFSEAGRKERKQILKLARDIHKNNADFDKVKEGEKSPIIEVMNDGD